MTTMRKFDLETVRELRPRRVRRLCTDGLPQGVSVRDEIRAELDWQRLLRGAAAEHGITWHVDIGIATTDRDALSEHDVRRTLRQVLDECVYAWHQCGDGGRS
jgi:hypothetical protein